MKIELFVNKDWKTSEKKFTHYWYNEGQNFFDSVNQTFDGFHTFETENIDFVSEYDGYKGPTEAYLEQFKKAGYSWQEINPVKFQRNDIFSGSIQIDNEDFNLYPVLFLRVTEDGDEFPKYYYSETIADISDQNFPNSYVIPLKMDMWATYWVYMHHFMKDSTEDVDFVQKMANRFLFNTQYNEEGERVDSQGFIIDYLKQPYLMRTNKYDTNLVVNDNRANFLTLEQWLFINSGKKDLVNYEDWLANTWLPWMENPYVGAFNPLEKIDSGADTPSFVADGVGKLQNKAYTQLDGFYDTDYNANTKYRYLICKVGNNASKSKADEGKMVEAKRGMFTNFNFDAVKIEGAGEVTCESLDTTPWTEDKPQSYSWYRELNLTGINLGSGAVCINWDNWLINDKYLTINFNSSVLGDYTVTWVDDLSLKSHRTVLTNATLNKEYSIIDLPTKSYAFDIYGDFVNVTLSINIKFTDNDKAVLVFRVKFDKNYEKIIWPEITVTPSKLYVINNFKVSQSGSLATKENEEINGETLMIIPFKKGEDERNYIKWLNDTNYGICMGDGSVLGMPINDIPPSVLALAIRRQNDKSDWQNVGDALSIRSAEGILCPLDLVNFKLGSANIPVMFTGFDNIPITVATAPLLKDIYQCVGGNNFFNYYYDILTNSYLTGNTQYYDFELGEWKIHGGNTLDVEPFLYSPQFWKWSYFIDGTHVIELTGEKIDFEKLLTKQDWEVKLNVNFNSITNYFLDITDIKNNKYPMTKLGMELINGDPSSYPFTTEAYNNWLQGNQLTQETSKNAKDITNEYVKKRGIVDATVGALESGTLAGANTKGGLLKKAIVGGTVAAAHAAGAIAGMEFTMQENTAQFENKWRGELSNYYNSPSQLNPSGFSSGSLIYSPISAANSNSYELFRTFSAPTYVKERVWHDISINGYPFVSQCKYSEYNNRIRFNVVNCNLNDKQYIFFNYLREKMFGISPMFANDDAILTFIKKCQDLFRVFKCEYNADKMEQIISENIELDREWCEPYYAPKRILVFENVHSLVDLQDESWVWNNEYSWTKEDNTYYLSKNSTNEDYNVDISYEDLYVSNWTEFLNTYKTLSLGNKGSGALLYYDDKVTDKKVIYNDSVVINDAEYGPESLTLPTEITKFINAITPNDILNKSIYVTVNSVDYKPDNYTLGWNVTLSDIGTGIHVKLEPVSKWTFTSTVDITSGTINNINVDDYSTDIKLPVNISVDRKTFEWNKDWRSYKIYHNGIWANDFSSKMADRYYYAVGEGMAFKLLAPEKGKFKTTISYDALGIKSYKEFYAKYKSVSFDVSGIITAAFNWPKQIAKKEYGGSKKFTLNLKEDQTQYLKALEIVRLGGANDDSVRLTWGGDFGWDTCFEYVEPYNQGTIGHSQHGKGGAIPARCDAKYAVYNLRISYDIHFNDSIKALQISIEDTTYVANWGNGFGTNADEGLEQHANDCYITFGHNNNMTDFSSSMRVNSITFNGGKLTYPSKWVMQNNINTLNFIKNEPDYYKSYILKQKNKEGN